MKRTKKPLPTCPLCGNPPVEWRSSANADWMIGCWGGNDRNKSTHDILVYQHEPAQSEALWRELAGPTEVMRGELETKRRMLEEIHRRAGVTPNGLAGILGWIDDANDAIAERGRKLARARKRTSALPDVAKSVAKDGT